MRIEDGEEIFGKRWDSWSEKETREFVSCMTMDEVNVPGCLMMLLKFSSEAPANIQEWLASMKEMPK